MAAVDAGQASGGGGKPKGGRGGRSNPGKDARGNHPTGGPRPGGTQSDAQYVLQFLIDKGLSPNAAAGVVGNLIAESGLNTGAVGDGGTSIGIAQWHLGRADALRAWAGQHGGSPYDLDTQLGFLWHELSTSYSGVLSQLQSTHNAYEATAIFMRGFESPADQSQAAVDARFQHTQEVQNGGGPTGTTGSGPTGSSGSGPTGGGGGGNDPYARQQANAERDRNATNYGYAKDFLDAHPEIKKLVDQAEKEHWTEARLAYEIRDTDWWKNHDKAQRQWSLLVAEQPKDAQAAIADSRKMVQQMAGQAGVQLSGNELDTLAEKAARNQWSQAEVQYALARHFDMPGKGDALTGAAGAADTMLTQMAADYGVTLDRKTRANMVQRSIQGTLDPSTMTDYFREQAKILYPNAKALLDQNHSLRDILSPFLSVAANELGIPADQIQLTDPKWTKPLSGPNGIMNLDEWTTAYRTDKRYGWDSSPGGRAAGADIANGLMQMFGQGF